MTNSATQLNTSHTCAPNLLESRTVNQVRQVRPRLLDLYCGAGGASMGYYRAGFDVFGVDNDPKPLRHYPFPHVCADALEYCQERGREFDAIHASPPCQRYSRCTPQRYRGRHPDMIASTREVIKQTGTPYAIENVPDARRLLNNPMMLCGTMFGLPTQRHRYFEIWPECFVLQITCQHDKLPIVVTGTTRRATGRLEYLVSDCRRAMDIDWMTRSGLDNAIPPAYTEFVGNLLIAALEKWRQVNNGTQS